METTHPGPLLARTTFLVLALVAALAARAQPPSPVGLWKTISDRTGKPDGMVRIVQEDGAIVGRVVSILRSSDADANPLCEQCQGALRNQPVIGLTILR